MYQNNSSVLYHFQFADSKLVLLMRLFNMCIGMHHGPQGPPGFPQHQHMQGPQPGQGPPQRGPPPGSMGGERLRMLVQCSNFISQLFATLCEMHDIEGN